MFKKKSEDSFEIIYEPMKRHGNKRDAAIKLSANAKDKSKAKVNSHHRFSGSHSYTSECFEAEFYVDKFCRKLYEYQKICKTSIVVYNSSNEFIEEYTAHVFDQRKFTKDQIRKKMKDVIIEALKRNSVEIQESEDCFIIFLSDLELIRQQEFEMTAERTKDERRQLRISKKHSNV